MADETVENRQYRHCHTADESATDAGRVRINFQWQSRAMTKLSNLKMPHLGAGPGWNDFLFLQRHRIVCFMRQDLLKPSNKSHDESDCPQN